MQRRGDVAITGLVACIGMSGDGTIDDPRLAWLGMGTRPLRAPRAEDAMRGQTPGALDLASLADLALEDTDPIEDSHGTPEYRRLAGHALFQRLLRRVLA